MADATVGRTIREIVSSAEMPKALPGDPKKREAAANNNQETVDALVENVIRALGCELTPVFRSRIAARLCCEDVNRIVIARTDDKTDDGLDAWGNFYVALARHLNVESHVETLMYLPHRTVMGGVKAKIADSLAPELKIRLSRRPYARTLNEDFGGYMRLYRLVSDANASRIICDTISSAPVDFQNSKEAANALVEHVISALGYDSSPGTRSLIAARLCYEDVNSIINKRAGWLSLAWGNFYIALAKHLNVESHVETILHLPHERVMGGVKVRIAMNLKRELAINLSRRASAKMLDDSLRGYILQYSVTEYGDRHPQFKPKTGENQPPKPRAAPAEPAATV